MKNRIIILLVLLTLCVHSTAFGQHSTVDSLAMYHEATALNSGKIQQEMIYLHLDNTAYYQDDRIHFACYVVTSGKLQPSDMSRTVYVELLNPSGKIIDHCILKTVNGRCHGSLLVNERPFYSGYYEIRAYTRYMLSFGPETTFSRVIPVFNTPTKEGNWAERNMLEYGSPKHTYNRPKPVKAKDVNLKFYPEGGRLVAGLPATVAFEVTDEKRRPIEAEGSVIDPTDGTVVATFKSGHMGRGAFSFTPAGRKYTAEVIVNNKHYSYQLPEPVATGISLSVDNIQAGDSIRINVFRTPGAPLTAVGATLSCRNELCSRAILDLTKTMATSFSVARDKLPTGIIQLTLFNAAGEPIADRLFFNNRNDFVNIDYTFNKPQYGPMEPVEMQVRLTRSASGEPEQTPFSIAVTDAENHLPCNHNMMTDILLSSEIKGYVHHPAWYFQEPTDTTRQRALDCLLMVQGWRRYPWSRLAGMETFSVDSLPEKGIEVHGLVLAKSRNQPQPGVTVSAMITKLETDSTYQKQMFLDTYTTDQNGRFAFRTYVKGNYLLTLSTSKRDEIKPYRIILNTSEGPELRGYDVAEMQVSTDAAYAMNINAEMPGDSTTTADDDIYPDDKNARRLREVEVLAKTKPWDIGQVISESVVSYDIEAAQDAILDGGKRFLRNLTDLLPLIDSDFHYGRSFQYKGKDVIFALDRNLGNNTTAVASSSDFCDPALLPVQTIKNVYINTTWAVIYENVCQQNPYADMDERLSISRQTGCVVYIELYPEARVKMRSGMRRTTLEGYSEPVEYYSPDYTDIAPFNTDFRRTLYWNPEVRTDSLGTANIRFFNNSTAKQFNVTAATVTLAGSIGGK